MGRAARSPGMRRVSGAVGGARRPVWAPALACVWQCGVARYMCGALRARAGRSRCAVGLTSYEGEPVR